MLSRILSKQFASCSLYAIKDTVKCLEMSLFVLNNTVPFFVSGELKPLNVLLCSFILKLF